jgi:hypothetical protein
MLSGQLFVTSVAGTPTVKECLSSIYTLSRSEKLSTLDPCIL